MINVCYYYFIFEFLIMKRFLTSDSKVTFILSEKTIQRVRLIVISFRFVVGLAIFVVSMIKVMITSYDEDWALLTVGSGGLIILVVDIVMAVVYFNLLYWFVEMKYLKISSGVNK